MNRIFIFDTITFQTTPITFAFLAIYLKNLEIYLFKKIQIRLLTLISVIKLILSLKIHIPS